MSALIGSMLVRVDVIICKCFWNIGFVDNLSLKLSQIIVI